MTPGPVVSGPFEKRLFPKKQAMYLFWAFVKKEFRHVLRDRRSLLILIGLPITMVLLYGFALSNEVRNSRFVVLDHARDEASRKLAERLDQSRYFSLVRTLRDAGEIEQVFRRNEARLVVVFPPHFEQDLLHTHQAQVQLIADAADPNTANIVITYASAVVREYQMSLLGDRQLPYSVDTEVRMLYNPQLKSAYNFVPGVITVILTLLGAMMTSVSIVREKELGTMEILLASPVRPLFVVLSKTVPYMALCFFDVLLVLLVATQVLDMPIRGSLVLLLAESLLFILTALSMGLLISTRAATQQVAMFMSLVGLLMPTLVFSGYMFPIENMPYPLQVVSNVVPTRWFYSILRDVMVKGLDFSHVWQETLVLLGMTLFFLAVALRNFKIRLA
jgi:ABC-2 type transport system permease protein